MTKAQDFPFDTVEIRCDHCGRHGKYSKARFVEIVGAETDMATARRIISGDCKEERPGPTNMHAPCRPYYTQDWWKSDPAN